LCSSSPFDENSKAPEKISPDTPPSTNSQPDPSKSIPPSDLNDGLFPPASVDQPSLLNGDELLPQFTNDLFANLNVDLSSPPNVDLSQETGAELSSKPNAELSSQPNIELSHTYSQDHESDFRLLSHDARTSSQNFFPKEQWAPFLPPATQTASTLTKAIPFVPRENGVTNDAKSKSSAFAKDVRNGHDKSSVIQSPGTTRPFGVSKKPKSPSEIRSVSLAKEDTESLPKLPELSDWKAFGVVDFSSARTPSSSGECLKFSSV
jgi:hypothetical protein